MTDELSCSITEYRFSEIEFHDGKHWIFRIRASGIVFNHEERPDSTASDFAKAFCDVLEKQYDVSFTKRPQQTDISSFGAGAKCIWKNKSELLDQFPE